MKYTALERRAMRWYRLPWKVYERQLLEMQYEIAENYMSGNLRQTLKLMEKLT